VLSAYTLSQHQPANEHTLSVVCERGMLVFDLHRHCWRAMTTPDTPRQVLSTSCMRYAEEFRGLRDRLDEVGNVRLINGAMLKSWQR